jgi:hypothetical protein
MERKPYEIILLEPKCVDFERVGDTLSLTLEEGGVSVRYPRVIVRAAFPVSDKATYLSVRDASHEDHPEIGIVEDLRLLDPSDRDAVEAELQLYYLVPVITQVLAIREELGFLYWTVETDKGRREFVMRNSVIHCAREVEPGHWLLIDVNEARYAIRRVTALDGRSQRLLKRFLYL